jgi:uncharacterized protein
VIETDFRFDVSEDIGSVSASLIRPPQAWLIYVLAHGAGAGMRHPFLGAIASSLAEQGVATIRYQFPYMEAGRKRPDLPSVLETTVKAAVTRAQELAPGLPVIAGGKSLGGRMTSGAAAAGYLQGISGLAFLGFPLHPPGQAGTRRADHLDQVHVPMLFLQGTRDEFARLELLREVCDRLGSAATLHLVDGGDHSFNVLKRSGRTRPEVMEELTDAIVAWARPMRPDLPA